jgi:hypothetical protein
MVPKAYMFYGFCLDFFEEFIDGKALSKAVLKLYEVLKG